MRACARAPDAWLTIACPPGHPSSPLRRSIHAAATQGTSARQSPAIARSNACPPVPAALRAAGAAQSGGGETSDDEPRKDMTTAEDEDNEDEAHEGGGQGGGGRDGDSCDGHGGRGHDGGGREGDGRGGDRVDGGGHDVSACGARHRHASALASRATVNAQQARVGRHRAGKRARARLYLATAATRSRWSC